jgi:putative inorganic carbon (HCO3(-)) transporter
MSKVINKINFGLIIFVIIISPLWLLLAVNLNLVNSTVPFYYYEILYFLIPLEIFIYVYKIVKKEVKLNYYDMIVFLILILLMLVTNNSIDIDTSIWGAYGRNEGFLSILCYYLLFLNSKSLDEKQINIVIKTFFEVGIIQFIYCLLQVFFRFSFIKTFEISGVNYMAMGFIGNPNFLGSYCIMLLGLALMLYFVKSERKYFGLSIIFFINLILAQSTGPFFAFIILFIFMIVFMKIKGIIDWKKIGIVCVSFILTFIIVSNGVELYCKKVFNDKIVSSYTIKGDILNTLNLFGVSKGNNEENITIEDYGSGRITIWKRSLKIVPKYFWLGSGLDTFGYVFPQKSGIFYDKAHNEYLQMLITTGIFTLLSYLIILFSLFIDGVKSNNKLVWVLMMPFIGYALQAFLNISVIFVAPTFYIIMGMMAGLISQEKVKGKLKKVA